jgi:hypothetical protein
LPFKANADRRHRIPMQRFRVTNWAEYDAALRGRGSLTVWFTDAAIAAWKAAPRTTRGGRFCQISRQNCCRTRADAAGLRCPEDGEHGCRATEVKHATAAGGDRLVVTHARTEMVAEFVVAPTEALG